MFVLIFKKDDSFFLIKKLASSWGAPQENDAKFTFTIHPQGIRQSHDNCQRAKCQTVAPLPPANLYVYLINFPPIYVTLLHVILTDLKLN